MIQIDNTNFDGNIRLFTMLNEKSYNILYIIPFFIIYLINYFLFFLIYSLLPKIIVFIKIKNFLNP